MLGMLWISSWVAPPAAWASTSTEPNPTVAFSTPGTKLVNLTVCAGAACDSLNQNVVVLDPLPAVTSAGALLSFVEAGQLVRLDGSGTGKPPLDFSWRVTPLTAPAFTVSGNPAWWDTTGMVSGLYTVALTISNTAGSAVSLPFLVTVQEPRAAELYTVSPCRAYDSRTGLALASGSSRTLGISASGCGIPADARAVVLNVTAVTPTGVGYATLYPGNYPQPATSTINFAAGVTRANAAVMGLATDASGTVNLSIFVANGGSTHFVVDVTGYFQALPL